MSCARCGRTNRAGARFCAGCGSSLTPRCPACGAETARDAHFCDACGATLRAATEPADGSAARKVVTIVFADLIGSTALHEKLDPESVSRVMEAYHAAVRAPIEAHGGTVVQLLGDGVMCAFGVPQVAEDDALRAVRAAVAVQESFRAFLAERADLAGRVGLRVAVNTGEVVVSDDYTAGIGDPLNVAARLQQEARDGDVLIGGATQRFITDQVTLAPIGSFALKGRAEPVAAFRVVSLERPARGAVEFVGRTEELRRLAAVHEAAVAAPHAKLAIVLGSPGLGKSRLLSELARGLAGRATVLVAQCAAGSATFAPLAEALRAALDAAALSDPAERARIESGIRALLAGTPAPPEETFFVVRRLLAALAAAQPVLLTIDDLHWAEPLLLDLLEHLVQWGAGVPLLVVGAARPELRDVRSSLASAGGLVAEVVQLGGLDASAATRLAARVIGAEALPAAVAGRVLATSEGNPLFLGELVRMLVNDGTLRREGERWVTAVELARLEMPPNIQALLAARIERVRPEERLVLERAAVVGRRFSRAAVAHLLPREAQSELDARLEALRRSELIEPDADSGWFLGEPALRFHHVLIRDAAYRRPLRHTRAELHARFADWLAERAGSDTTLHDETIGWHLEQSFQHRRELGGVDAATLELGARAARHLADAGRRALARDDLPPAASLLRRALDCLETDDPARAELSLDLGEALLASGDVAPAAAALAELARLAGASERLQAWLTCFRGQLAVLSDPQALHASAEAVAAAARTLASVQDAAGEAKAHSVHALVLAQLGKIGASEAALDRALAAARQARDRRLSNAVLAGAPVAALWGPSPVARASGRCLDVVRVLRITQGAPAVEAVSLRCQAVLESLRGRSDAAHRMIATSRHMVEELGIGQRVLEADVFAGLIELLEGDGAAAERWLRPAYAGLRARGLDIAAAHAAALLGRALLAQDRAEEAEALSRESEALAGDSFQAAIAWRGVRAEALAARGEHAAAVEVASKAVGIAAATDDLLDHADARQALAAALRAAGRGPEAEAEAARAVELWQEKGATLLLQRARRETRSTVRAAHPAQRVQTAANERRIGKNAATANRARIADAISAGDFGALDALFASDLAGVDHATGMVVSRDGALASLRGLWNFESLAFRVEPLAILGESLALFRQSSSGSAVRGRAIDMGAVEIDLLGVCETDASGRCRFVEFFAPDHLGDAIARLYARHAELLPEGAARTRAAATARTVARLLRPFDSDGEARAFVAPDVAFEDQRRTVSLGSWRGVEGVLGVVRSLNETTSDRVIRIDDVIALRPNALLVRETVSGVDRASGGDYERSMLMLWAFGVDGRSTHWELRDVDCVEEALARFDTLSAEPPPARFANAAVRTAERFMQRWAARDWDAMIGTFAPSFEVDDRRALVGVPMSGPEFFANQRLLFELKSSRWHSEVVATRGERFALRRTRFSGEDDQGGPIDAPMLSVTEVDETDRYVRQVLFDVDAVDAAYQALDALYVAGEGAAYTALLTNMLEFGRALAAGDRESLTRILPDDFRARSHRRFANVGASLTRDEYIANLGVYDQLGARTEFRVDHLRTSDSALILDATLHGTRAGGEFEQLFLLVAKHDGRRLRSWELFELEQSNAALARYAELSAEPAPARFTNRALQAMERVHLRWRDRDWDGVVANHASGFVMDDRRALVGVAASGEDFLTNLRFMYAMPSSGFHYELLATRAERLVLCRTRFTGQAVGGGAIDVPMLSLAEVDDGGRYTRLVLFDRDAVEAAYAELDARYFAGEAGAHPRVSGTMKSFVGAFEARAWDALGALFDDGLAVNDHRRLGWETLRGPAAYVATLRSLVELAPDVRLRLDHVRASARGLLWAASWVGTREGGPFETPWVTVSEHDAQGRVVRFDQYDVEQLGAALARFEGLRRGPDPLRVPPNAADRARERVFEALARRDWPALRALASERFTFEDRGRRALVSGGIEAWLESLRVIQAEGGHLRRELLATAGDRLALERILGTAEPAARGFEIQQLIVSEVDEEGRLLACVRFDPEDRRAASIELMERVTRQPDAYAPTNIPREVRHAIRDRDIERIRALLPADFVYHDHRSVGAGRLGRDEYVTWVASLFEQSPDAMIEPLYFIASEPHASLAIGHTFGTLADGGQFETIYAQVIGPFGIELFDLDDLAHARARFEALRPGALTIPPNAASLAVSRRESLFSQRDWAALRALPSAGFVFEDRRRRALVSGGVELWISNLEVIASWVDRRTSLERVATVGERIELGHLSFSLEAGGVEGEFLRLVEVDAEGRLAAWIHFDVEDRAAAFAEAHARFTAGEAAGDPGQAVLAALGAAFRRRDWTAMRACYTDAAHAEDHRTLGLGSFPIVGWIESLRALAELAPDVANEVFRILAWNGRGRVALMRQHGTREGGLFENVFITLAATRGDRIWRFELFDVADAERALARFAELAAASP